MQAGTQLSAAHAALSAAGSQSEVHGPLSRRLMQAAGWSQAVAAHATDLAGYTAAAATHASTYRQAVGSSEGWQALKTGYQQAIAENATGGLMQNVVDAYSAALTDQQQSASAAMTGYQGTGQALAIPGQLPDPGLALESPAGDDGAGQTDPKHAENMRDRTSRPPTCSPDIGRRRADAPVRRQGQPAVRGPARPPSSSANSANPAANSATRNPLRNPLL